MSSVRNLMSAVIVLGVIALPASARAQSAATEVQQSTASAPAISAALAGPRIAPTGIRQVNATAAARAQRSQPQSMGKPMALMIVGGAAFVLGALIGGDVGTLFMLGGAVGFLIGLYEYIK